MLIKKRIYKILTYILVFCLVLMQTASSVQVAEAQVAESAVGLLLIVSAVGGALGGIGYTVEILTFHDISDFSAAEFAGEVTAGALLACAGAMIMIFGSAELVAYFEMVDLYANPNGLTADLLAGELADMFAGFYDSILDGMASALNITFQAIYEQIILHEDEFAARIGSTINELELLAGGDPLPLNFVSSWADFMDEEIASMNMTVHTESMQFDTALGASWRMDEPGVSFVSGTFIVNEVPYEVLLSLNHLVASFPGSPGDGYAPVDIYINGNLAIKDYDVATSHGVADTYVTDIFDISPYLQNGENTIVILLDSAALSDYVIQTMTIQPGRLYSNDSISPSVTGSDYTASDPNTNIYIQFSEAMDPSTIDNTSVLVIGSSSGSHSSAFSLDPISYELTINPNEPFLFGETVVVTMNASITDLNGNYLDEPFVLEFNIAENSSEGLTLIPSSYSVNYGANPVKISAYLVDASGEPLPDTEIMFGSDKGDVDPNVLITDDFGYAETWFFPIELGTATVFSFMTSDHSVDDQIEIEVTPIDEAINFNLQVIPSSNTATTSTYNIRVEATLMSTGEPIEDIPVTYTVRRASNGSLFGVIYDRGDITGGSNPFTEDLDSLGRSSVDLVVGESETVEIFAEINNIEDSIIAYIIAGEFPPTIITPFELPSTGGDEDLSLSPDGNFLIATSQWGHTDLINAITYTILDTIISNTSASDVYGTFGSDYAPDNNLIAMGVDRAGDEGDSSVTSVYVYDTSLHSIVSELQAPLYCQTEDVAFSPDGLSIASIENSLDYRDERNWFRVYDTQTGGIRFSSPAGDGAVSWSIPFGGYSNGIIALGSPRDGTINFYDGGNFGLLRTIPAYDGNRTIDLEWSPQGNKIAIGFNRGAVYLYDWTSNSVTTLHQHEDDVLSIDWTHDGNYFVTAGKDPNIILWNGNTGVTTQVIDSQCSEVQAVEWSADGKDLFVTCDWDLSLFALTDNTGPIISIDVPQNNSILFQQEIEISGEITDPHLVCSAWLKINDGPSLAIDLNLDGSFTKSVSLENGNNLIQVFAEDGPGNMSSLNLEVEVGLPDLHINEVDVGNPDKIEIFNNETKPVSLQNLTMLTYSPSGDQEVTFTFPEIVMDPQSYLVIYEGGDSANNSNSIIYLGDHITTWTSGAGGAVAMISDSGVGIDFVRWGNSIVPAPNGISWTGENPISPPQGFSLGRDSVSLDTDSGSDWCIEDLSFGSVNSACKLISAMPVIESIEPETIIAGSESFSMLITGTGFNFLSTVMWNDEEKETNKISETQLEIIVTAQDIAEAAIIEISVVNPPPGGGQSNIEYFEILPNEQIGPIGILDLRIDDDLLDQSIGNADGIAQCGETIELYISITNEGTVGLSNITGSLSATDNYVTWLDENFTSAYPDIQGDSGGAENFDDFEFALSPDTPDGYTIEFDYSFASAEGGPWDLTFSLPVSCLDIPDEETPTGSFVTPLDHGVMLSPRSQIVVTAQDAGSGVRFVEFWAYYDQSWHFLGKDENGSDGWRFLWPTMNVPEQTIKVQAVIEDNAGNKTIIEVSEITLSSTFVFGNGYEPRSRRTFCLVEIWTENDLKLFSSLDGVFTDLWD